MEPCGNRAGNGRPPQRRSSPTSQPWLRVAGTESKSIITGRGRGWGFELGEGRRGRRPVSGFAADFLPLRCCSFGPAESLNRERWEGRRGRQRVLGFRCGLPPSAALLFGPTENLNRERWEGRRGRRRVLGFRCGLPPSAVLLFGPAGSLNRERWEGRRGRQRVLGIRCGLPPSAVWFLWAGRMFELFTPRSPYGLPNGANGFHFSAQNFSAFRSPRRVGRGLVLGERND